MRSMHEEEVNFFIFFFFINFSERVYEVAKKVPKGKISTYKEIGRILNTKAYRAIGTALSKNYHASVPCHRIVKSNGEIGGFFGKTKGKEVKRKINLLKKEGIKIRKNKVVDFNNRLFRSL